MKLSINWLREHLDTVATVEHIVTTLNRLGLVVDGQNNLSDGLENFIIAEIVAAEPHPQADRLQVCKVNTGHDIIQVVCGAANARAGLKTVLAQPGVKIPANGMVIKNSKIRDVDSQGMLCSYGELGMSNNDMQDGIIELPASAPLGERLCTYKQLDDVILDIDVTPNRGDCFAVQGLARDLAAAGVGTLIDHSVKTIEGTFDCPIHVKFDLPNSASTACAHFSGRVIRGLKNGPSPEWLQRKLQAVGMKSISALVDITNYMAMDWARPLHVFDADKINDHLTIRLSRHKETMLGLDDRDHTLDDTITVIADDYNANKVLAIAGIMGGQDSGCSHETTSVFLESAYFDRVRTALSGQKLGIHSEARVRFERGVDAELVLAGLHRATQLILDLCGGEASTLIDIRSNDHQIDIQKTRQPIIFKKDDFIKRSGFDVPLAEMTSIMQGLGFDVTSTNEENTLSIVAPSWRHDVHGPHDIIEEIVRLKGYDSIPSTTLPHTIINHGFESVKGSSLRQQREHIARRTMAAQGLLEALTWSFLRHDHACLFGGGDGKLILDNPLNQDLSVMRPSLLPHLINAIGRNLARKQDMPAFFEVGNQFSDATPLGQTMVVSGVRSGRNRPRHWQLQGIQPSLYSVKSDCLALLNAYGMDAHNIQIQASAPSWYHPGRSGAFMLGPKNTLAFFGEIHPHVLKEMDVAGSVYAFEIFLDHIPKPRLKQPFLASSFQPVERDLAFIVDGSITAQTLFNVIYKVDKDLIKKVSLFDVYQPKLDDNKKSMAFCIRIEPQQQTLTDHDIQQLMTRVIDAVQRETGGELRS